MPRVVAKTKENYLFSLYVMTKPMQLDIRQMTNRLYSMFLEQHRTTYYKMNINVILDRLVDFHRMLGGEPGGYLINELSLAAEEEKRLAMAQYEATAGAKARSGQEGIWEYLQSDNFAFIQLRTHGVALVIGDKEILDEMTSSWRDKYAGLSAKDWSGEQEPPYLNTGIGYWRWQEFGARKSRFWLKRTAKWAVAHDIPLSSIGGNIRARHIFLQTVSEAKEDSKRLALKLTAKFARDFSKNLYRLVK